MQDTRFVESYLVPALRLPPDRLLLSSSLPPGQRLFDAVERALSICRMTLLVLTPDFMRESWTSYGEVLASYHAAQGDRSLVPALLTSCELPTRLKMWVPLDLRDPAHRESELARLREVLQLPGQRTPAPTASSPQARSACRSARLRRRAVQVGLASIMALIPTTLSPSELPPDADPKLDPVISSTPASTPLVKLEGIGQALQIPRLMQVSITNPDGSPLESSKSLCFK